MLNNLSTRRSCWFDQTSPHDVHGEVVDVACVFEGLGAVSSLPKVERLIGYLRKILDPLVEG
jgi:hypothetical protein